MAMKAMLSQHMAEKTSEEIQTAKVKAVKNLESMGYEVVDTLFSGDWCNPESLKKLGITNIPLWFLSKSFEKMSECDAVYFCKGWELARGCRIEHEAATSYGLKCYYE